MYAAAGGLAAALLCAGPTWAEEVTITSAQGALTLTGRIAGYDGTYLEIESSHGPVTLAYAGVTCAGADCPPRDGYIPTLRLSGEPVLSGLLVPALLAGYARETGLALAQEPETDDTARFVLQDTAGDPLLHVRLRAGSSAEAFADLITFETDIALTYRAANPREIDRAKEVGLDLAPASDRSLVLGGEALVAVTSPRNPQRTIDPAAIIAAFAGRIVDWQSLGQAPQPLTLHLGPAQDGQVEAFLALLPKPPAAPITYHATAADLAAAVAADPGALGVTPLRATGVAQPLGLRDNCGLTMVPRLAGLKTQDYPLTTLAFAVVRSHRQPDVVRDLLRWLRSPAAQLIVRRAGLSDQGITPIPLDDQGERIAHAVAIAGPDTSLRDLQDMVALMLARVRISLTFRFANGTTDLDTASAANLRTLALAIRNSAYAGRDIMLIGFSDAEGEAEANRDLSAARALAVESALLTLLGHLPDNVRIGTRGFGEALPMGCDDTSWGRRMNRRVEVWVGD
ncbi:MAG: OmpA family protein [Alphaproteobacteria bacterium]|nr:OmpA family protein [Alphaproteobacteria bacterium]